MTDNDVPSGESPTPPEPRAWSTEPPAPPAPAPPPPPTWTPPGAQVQYQPDWRSVRGLAVALQVLLWIAVGLMALTILALVNERSVGEDFFDGDVSAIFDFADAIDIREAAQGLTGVLGIAILVLNIIYLWRGAKNIEVLGRTNPPLGRAWAIGAWFIPIANAILVPMVFAGVWKGSDTTIAPGDPNWKRAALTPLLVLWWIAFVVGATLFSVGSSGFTNDDGLYETVGDFRAASNFSFVGTAVLIVATILAIVFLRQLTRRLNVWGRHLGLDGTPPTPGALTSG